MPIFKTMARLLAGINLDSAFGVLSQVALCGRREFFTAARFRGGLVRSLFSALKLLSLREKLSS